MSERNLSRPRHSAPRRLDLCSLLFFLYPYFFSWFILYSKTVDFACIYKRVTTLWNQFDETIPIYPGSRGPKAERAGETAKGKLPTKRKASGLGRWESHFYVCMRFRFWIVSDWLGPWTSDLIGSLYQTSLTSTVEANQRYSKSEPDTTIQAATLCLYVDSNFIVCNEANSGKFESASAK